MFRAKCSSMARRVTALGNSVCLAYFISAGISVCGQDAKIAEHLRIEPAYDVVSIRPASETPKFRGAVLSPSQIEVILPVAEMVAYAYGSRPQFVFGGPAWATSKMYDVVAKDTSDEDARALSAMSKEERAALFQAVLTQRFGLSIHHEMRSVSVYDLIAVREGLGPNLHRVSSNAGGITQAGTAISGRGVTMDGFSRTLTTILLGELGRPIVNRTHLDGTFDFALRWSNPELTARTGGNETTNNSLPSSVFTALKEQLGLKLEPNQESVDCIVIDVLTKPTDN